MTYYWITFLIIIGILFGYFYRRKFFDLNRKLFSYLESNNFNTRLDSVEATFSVTGAWSWSFFKFYSDGKSIILIDQHDLDLNKNSKLYAQTYLITTTDQLTSYPISIFKNLLTIKTIEFDAKKNLVINGNMSYQTLIPQLPWTRHSDNFTLKIKKPFEKFNFEEMVKYAH